VEEKNIWPPFLAWRGKDVAVGRSARESDGTDIFSIRGREDIRLPGS
jgi:hypothetical protein